MNQAISILTAAFLLTHSLLGCCSHHEHESAGGAELVAASDCGTCCSPADGEADGADPADHDSPSRRCEGSSCNYLLVDGPRTPDQLAKCHLLVASLPLVSVAECVEMSTFLDAAMPLQPPLAALRLHLVFGVLLI